MKSNDEISALIEDLKIADDKRISADTVYAATATQVREALQERAQMIINELWAEGKEPVVLRNRSTRINGWVLVHHPATPKRLGPLQMTDGHMLVVDRNWTFWSVERWPSPHNPEIEVTGDINKYFIDKPVWANHVWDMLQTVTITDKSEEHS